MNATMPPARSYLFVPADRPERFAKALESGADAVIFDLEDAVAPADKDKARATLAAWLPSAPAHGPRMVVRINDDASPWHDADVAALRQASRVAVMLPKAESAAQVERIGRELADGTGVIALIETARGVHDVDVIAAGNGVERLAFGTLDYALDLGLPDDPRGLSYPASRIALASRIAGLPAPIAGVTAAFRDDDALRRDFELARACGFGAKLCIHPLQVAPLHALLAPSAAQRDWATRVLAAAQSGAGAIAVDGKMVDRPVLQRARAILGLPPASPEHTN